MHAFAYACWPAMDFLPKDSKKGLSCVNRAYVGLDSLLEGYADNMVGKDSACRRRPFYRLWEEKALPDQGRKRLQIAAVFSRTMRPSHRTAHRSSGTQNSNLSIDVQRADMKEGQYVSHSRSTTTVSRGLIGIFERIIKGNKDQTFEPWRIPVRLPAGWEYLQLVQSSFLHSSASMDFQYDQAKIRDDQGE
jgi:hypothetical protein